MASFFLPIPLLPAVVYQSYIKNFYSKIIVLFRSRSCYRPYTVVYRLNYEPHSFAICLCIWLRGALMQGKTHSMNNRVSIRADALAKKYLNSKPEK